MTKTYRFDPDYVVPTSEVLREWLEDHNLSPRVAVAHVVRSPAMRAQLAAILQAILDQDRGIDEDTAQILQAVTDISGRFWLSFERNYRIGLAAGKSVAV